MTISVFFNGFSRILFLALLVLALPAQATQAAAKDTGKEAEAFIKNMGTKAIESLTGEDITDAERKKRFRALLDETFAVKTIGRFALGRYWNEASDAQREEYQKLFEEMIVDVYATRFKEYSGQDFVVDGYTKASSSDYLVKSKIIDKPGAMAEAPPIVVEWRVRVKNDTPRIVDVLVEGVSMGVTQRSDFAAIIEKSGGKIDGLLESLKKRNGNNKS